jgi:hypothetical protein
LSPLLRPCPPGCDIRVTTDRWSLTASGDGAGEGKRVEAAVCPRERLSARLPRPTRSVGAGRAGAGGGVCKSVALVVWSVLPPGGSWLGAWVSTGWPGRADGPPGGIVESAAAPHADSVSCSVSAASPGGPSRTPDIPFTNLPGSGIHLPSSSWGAGEVGEPAAVAVAAGSQRRYRPPESQRPPAHVGSWALRCGRMLGRAKLPGQYLVLRPPAPVGPPAHDLAPRGWPNHPFLGQRGSPLSGYSGPAGEEPPPASGRHGCDRPPAVAMPNRGCALETWQREKTKRKRPRPLPRELP